MRLRPELVPTQMPPTVVLGQTQDGVVGQRPRVLRIVAESDAACR